MWDALDKHIVTAEQKLASKSTKSLKKEFRKLAEEAQAGQEAPQRQAEQMAQAQAQLELRQQEDDAAEQFDNARFNQGELADIWQRTKAIRTSVPPWGAISKAHSASDVMSWIQTWEATADSGIPTNFHVSGRRPQAKWEKDASRPTIEANFCVSWRGTKTNIHVTVNPETYLARFAADLDWTKTPPGFNAKYARFNPNR